LRVGSSPARVSAEVKRSPSSSMTRSITSDFG
jgi:hypothetical protein